eukprot:1914568-Ditylum_brightwellii.AAC.1
MECDDKCCCFFSSVGTVAPLEGGGDVPPPLPSMDALVLTVIEAIPSPQLAVAVVSHSELSPAALLCSVLSYQ